MLYNYDAQSTFEIKNENSYPHQLYSLLISELLSDVMTASQIASQISAYRKESSSSFNESFYTVFLRKSVQFLKKFNQLRMVHVGTPSQSGEAFYIVEQCQKKQI